MGSKTNTEINLSLPVVDATIRAYVTADDVAITSVLISDEDGADHAMAFGLFVALASFSLGETPDTVRAQIERALLANAGNA